MVASFPLCLGRHNGEVTPSRICQTRRVPQPSWGLTSMELEDSEVLRPQHFVSSSKIGASADTTTQHRPCDRLHDGRVSLMELSLDPYSYLLVAYVPGSPRRSFLFQRGIAYGSVSDCLTRLPAR